MSSRRDDCLHLVLGKPVTAVVLVRLRRLLMRFLNFIRGDGLHALIGGTGFVHAAVTLASGVEEAFHAAQVDNSLLR